MGDTAWEPLLTGSARDRTLDAVSAIADTLAGALPTARPQALAPTLNGSLGAVLLFAALDRPDAEPLLDDALTRVPDEAPTMSLYGPPLGAAWVAAVLGDAEENDADVFVSNVLDQPTWPWPVELMHGLSGLGTYCLARLPSDRARRDLDRVVSHLANTAVDDAGGLAWPFVPLPGAAFTFSELRPVGNVNVGFPHGMAGIVAFLASAVEAGVPGARDLLAPAVRWVLAHRLPAPGPVFPPFVTAGIPLKPARLAWCYGDPGMATALLAAGRALGDVDVVATAREVALRCIGRDDDVESATLCHGTAGLGHMFNRLGQALADEQLLDLARHWFTVTLDQYLPELTVLDREAAKRVLAEGGSVVHDPGFSLLFGPAGAALALLAAATDAEPWWDAPLFARRAPVGVTSVKHERHGGVTPPR